MTPYWQSKCGRWVIYHGDCLEILPQIPAGTVDAVVTDPPYGVGFKYASHDDSRVAYVATVPRWANAILQWPSAITPGIANVCLWPQPRWVLAWLKANSMGASMLSGPNAVSRNLWEPVYWYGSYPAIPPSRDIIHAPLNPETDRVGGHPCPKPIALMVPLTTMAASEGDTILDPFLGSGTTLVACVKTGRRGIGIELEERYCEIAARRIEAESSHLFAESI